MMESDNIFLYSIKNRIARSIDTMRNAPFPIKTGGSRKSYEKMNEAILLLEESIKILEKECSQPGRRKDDK